MSVHVKYKKILGKCAALESKLVYLTANCKIPNQNFLHSERGLRFLRLLKRSRVEAKQLEEVLGRRKFLRKLIEELKRYYGIEDGEGEKTDTSHDAEAGVAAGGEKKDPFKELPEEIVEMILGHLEDAKDLVTCNQVCNQFRKILKPRKTIWLFHEVLPLIVSLRYLTSKEVINLRGVCHEWKRRVDDLLKNSDLEGVAYSKSYKTAERQHAIGQLINNLELVPLKTIRALRNFKEQVVASASFSKSPFLCNSLTLQVGRNPDMLHYIDVQDRAIITQYCYKATKFLKLFGEQVERCDLHLEVVIKVDALLTLLQALCKNLPSVKKLKLTGCGEPLMRVGLKKKEVVKLEEYLSYNPFPALPYLTSLTVNEMPKYFYKLIFPRICSQLRKLDMGDDEIQLVLRGNQYELPHLTSLKLTCDTHHLFKLLSLTCPSLTHLVIDFKVMGREDGYRALLQSVQRFGLTLRELDIRAYDVASGSKREKAQPFFRCLQYFPMLKGYFPHLQILKVDNWFDSFDFLLCMPSLQYLVVKWSDIPLLDDFYWNVQSDEVVEIHGFVENMYKSNIWALMPNLMKVKFTSGDALENTEDRAEYYYPEYVYARDGYEYYVTTENQSNNA